MRYFDIAFTPDVKAIQAERGSREAYAKREDKDAGPTPLGPQEIAFIAARDSFYLASVGATGWPYIQHRGGPRGFVRVLNENQLGFADFRGNKQYISAGNFAGDDRAALFFMDYAARRRLKLFARAKILTLEDDPDLVQSLVDESYPAKAERAVLLSVEGYDWNCPQHITARRAAAEMEDVDALKARIKDLEAALAAQA